MTRLFLRLVVGGVTGKLLGLVREVLLAALFGAGRVVAANRIALTATLIPINFFTADALSAGFLPLYVQYRRDRPDLAGALYRGLRLMLAVFSVALLVVLLVGRDLWIGALAPGLDDSTAALAATMLGIAALGIPCYVQYSLYALVALAHDDASLVNLRASGQSLGLIGATVAAFLTGRVEVLAWGFSAPYLLLLAWGAFWVRRRGYLAAAGGTRVDRTSRRMALSMFWRRLRPLLLIPVVLQGSIAVERAVGSLLGVEVVAATEYARFVVDSAMALLAAPLGLASLAGFAKLRAEEVAGGLRRLTTPVLLLTLPLCVLLCVNCTGIVTLLYARGEFDAVAVTNTAVMLLGFALGIWASVLGYTYVKVLNARGANLRATLVTVLAFGSAIAVNLLLYRSWGAITLGVAASVCGVVMLVAAARALRVLGFLTGFLGLLLPGLAAAVAAGLALSGPGLWRLAASSAAVVAVWALYLAAVPRLRREFVATVWRRLRPRQRAADEPAVLPPRRGDESTAPARAASDRPM